MSMENTHKTLMEYLERIEGENGERCRRLFADHREKMTTAAGSQYNHQVWKGGYVDHLCEVMYFADCLYSSLGRPFPFSLSDAFLTIFLHDMEKPWKYA